MTSRATMLARRDSAPILVITIDGVGDYDGLWRFCTRRPVEYSSSRLYKDYLKDWPRILSQEAHPLGGVASSGEIEIELVDVNDELLDLLRTEARPQTRLAADQAAADTTVTVVSGAAIVPGKTVIYVGSEAQKVTGGASPTFNVTRAHLGTAAADHSDREPVYLHTNRIYGRRVRMYLTFGDPGYSEAEELAGEVSGGWSVDSPSLGAGLNSWAFSARSQLRFLDRLLLRRGFRGLVGSLSQDERYLFLQSVAGAGQKYFVAPHFDRLFFQTESGEIVRVAPDTTWLGRLPVDLRGAVGTRPKDIVPGDQLVQVWSADTTDGYGSFRYQVPGGETSSFSTGTWICSSHPVVILLTLLLSSADSLNNTPDNYDTNTGNFSGLPGGVGVGIPIAEVDVESFFEVWQRTQNMRLDHFVLDKSETARKVINRICKIVGFDLHQSGLKLALSYYRSPLEGEAGTVWDDDTILTEDAGNGEERPIFEAELDTSLTAGAVVFDMKTATGTDVQSVFTDADFGTLFGNERGYYEAEDQRIEIPTPYVRADSTGAEPVLLRQRALQLLYRFRRPLWRVDLATDLSEADVAAGSQIALTHAQMPNMATGKRGVIGAVAKLLEKSETIDPDFVGVHWSMIVSTTSARFGRVCPTGMFVSAAANDVTIVANRYTDPNSRGLPTSDASAFTVGDRVRLTDRAGTPIVTTPAYQTITGLVGDVVELDGDFGTHASFAAGTLIEYVGRDDQVEQQYSKYVSLADEATLTVGSSSDLAWGFSEP